MTIPHAVDVELPAGSIGPARRAATPGEPALHGPPAWRHDPRFLAAVALALAAYFAAELVNHLALATEIRTPTVASLRLLALLFALLGAGRTLERSYQERSAERTALLATADASRAAWEERAHEARSALSAIELAVYAAARRAGESGPFPVSLEELVRAEVALLRRLLDGDQGVGPREFSVNDAVHSSVAIERLRGADIDVRLPTEIDALGCPLATTEILRNLIENSRHHAPGATVQVSARRRRGTVVLRVEDDGPGIPPDIGADVFGRGVCGRESGSGLGLYIARSLAEGQGGSLELARRHRGAAFELALPAARRQRHDGTLAGAA